LAPKLHIPHLSWFKLIGELDRRGNRVRESGAFLLAPRGSIRLVRFAYYDDLAPGCLAGGYIRFPGEGYVALTRICQQAQLRVIGDVHTHPGRWTGQSGADIAHPMMARAGHLALIVPSYARGNRFSLSGVGAYEYRGDEHWRDCRGEIQLVWL
jgi:proteasome lid subunit RPN8/RPN11